MTIRVFLVDDQALVRAGFRMVIDAQTDMAVVGEAGDGDQALQQLAVTGADVVLMDVRMPRLDGVQATQRLVDRRADDAGADTGSAGAGDAGPRVLVLTTFDLDEYAFAALKAGASGFLLKDVPPEQLLSGIRTVASGDAVIAPSTTRRLIEHVSAALPGPSATGGDPFAALTDREREVLIEVAQGYSNGEIASRLFLSEATVKTHVGRVLAKLGLRDRVQAVVLAYEARLVRPGR